ncbi:hypothetical protein [Candidatus Aalborgicola defluviihabitans]
MLNLTGIYTAIGHHASLAQPGLATVAASELAQQGCPLRRSDIRE